MGIWRTAAAALIVLAAAGSGAAQQRPVRHHVTEQERQAARAALETFTSTTLTRFGDEAEFRRYVAAVAAEQRTRGDSYYTYSAAGTGPLRFAQASVPGQAPVQSDATGQNCIPTPPFECAEEELESITVTGSRVAPPRNPSITNNQMRGVEEGDIIKQIDHYLLVLQDGRIFVIDTTAGGTARHAGRALRLADRTNVYRYATPDSAYET